MMPKPRKAKNVSATLETMSLQRRVARRSEQRRVHVDQGDHGEDDEDPDDHVHDHGLGAWATSFDPTMFTAVITTMISTAKTLTQAAFSSANTALA